MCRRGSRKVGGQLREDREDSNGDKAEDISKEDQDVKEEEEQGGILSSSRFDRNRTEKETMWKGRPNTAELNGAKQRMNYDCMLCMSLCS